MPEVSGVLELTDIRNQLMLEGVKTAEWLKFAPYLKDIERELRNRLTMEGDSVETKKALDKLLSDVTKIINGNISAFNDELVIDLDELAILTASNEADSLNKVVDGYEAVIPDDRAVILAYQNAPLSIRNKGLTLHPFLSDFTRSEINLVTSAIRQGVNEGQTISQMVRVIRGTKKANYQDGILAQTNNNARAMVRTAVQNTNSQARQKLAEANDDLIKGVQMVATLDSGTTRICRHQDQKKYPLNKGPRPPFHYACRTTFTYIISSDYDFLDKGAKRPVNFSEGPEQTSASVSFYEAMKKQPAWYQDLEMGPTRGKLLRNGGLSAQEFADIDVSNNLKPRTLKEMFEIAPQAFDQAISKTRQEQLGLIN